MTEGRPKRTFVMVDAVKQGLGAFNGGHTVPTASAEDSQERQKTSAHSIADCDTEVSQVRCSRAGSRD